MPDREAQIEELWTCDMSAEKILRQTVKKGFNLEKNVHRGYTGQSPYFRGRNFQGKENIQPKLSYLTLDAAQYCN